MKGETNLASASGDGGETAGIQESAGSDEESATQVPRNCTCDNVLAGAHIVSNCDPALSALTGKFTDMPNATLSQVRVKVHLSNGV